MHPRSRPFCTAVSLPEGAPQAAYSLEKQAFHNAFNVKRFKVSHLVVGVRIASLVQWKDEFKHIAIQAAPPTVILRPRTMKRRRLPSSSRN